MSKYSGARCSGMPGGCINDPLYWCEKIGDDCSDGGIGDLNILEDYAALSIDDFRAKIDASETMFMLTKKGEFIKLGLFAGIGIQEGDKLIGVVENQKAHFYEYAVDRRHILGWAFKRNNLYVLLERQGEAIATVLTNPALNG